MTQPAELPAVIVRSCLQAKEEENMIIRTIIKMYNKNSNIPVVLTKSTVNSEKRLNELHVHVIHTTTIPHTFLLFVAAKLQRCSQCIIRLSAKVGCEWMNVCTSQRMSCRAAHVMSKHYPGIEGASRHAGVSELFRSDKVTFKLLPRLLLGISALPQMHFQYLCMH